MQSIFLSIIGGLGLFLLGISQLTTGLKQTSSSGMKAILKKLTGSPVMGTLMGVLVTAIIQSSSATTVLLVGFVNAGMMTLKQAVGVIFGANIGTTVTAQIMAFELSEWSALLITGGFLTAMFSKRETVKSVGTFVMGFGLIFFGMEVMSNGVEPLRDSPAVKDAFARLGHYPVLGVLAGMVATFMIQSSSATVGIVLTLLSTGILDIQSAIPIILGDNIGTCITAALASIGGTISARRTAAAHFGFNIIGTVIVLILLPLYIRFISLTSADPVRQAANAHTLFNIMNAIIFLPFTGLYARLIEFIIPGTVVVKEDRAIYLARNLLQSPAVALEAVNREMTRALSFCREDLDIVEEALVSDKFDRLEVMKENETITDNLQIDITSYLVELSRERLSEDQAALIPRRLHSINDIERIGDHGEALGKILKRMKKLEIEFPKEHTEDLITMLRKIRDYMTLVMEITGNGGYAKFRLAMEYENEIDQMKKNFQKRYLKSMKKDPDAGMNGMVFYDFLIHFERIGDHLTNIAEGYSLSGTKPVTPV